MGSGGPSNTTTTQSPPAWAVPTGLNLLNAMQGLVFQPGGTTGGGAPGTFGGFTGGQGGFAGGLPGFGGGGGYPGQVGPGVKPMPANMNQQVAPFNPSELAALQGMGGLAGGGAGLLGNTLSGQYLNPSSNPYLRQTYNQAAQGLVDQYQTATAPSLQAEGLQATAGGGPGALASNSAFQEAQSMNQFGLGQNLADLATQIYGGNYQQERQNQLQSLGQVGALQQSLFAPGQIGQQQQQSVLDTMFQNAQRANQYPFWELGQLGSAYSNAIGGSSVQVSPNTQGMK